MADSKKRRPREPLPDENPALANIVERNIRTILSLRARSAAERGIEGRIADLVTDFSGRMEFVYLHIAWFGG